MQRHILCDVHSLMPVGFLMYLSMSDVLPGCLFAVVGSLPPTTAVTG